MYTRNTKNEPQKIVSEEWTQRWISYHWGRVDILWCIIFTLLVLAIMYWSYIVF